MAIPTMPTARRLVAPAVAALLVVGAASCGTSGGDRTADGRLRIEASFYPLQWMAQEIGGRRVEVGSLTPPGAEPHDLELTPRQVAAVHDAGIVVYLSDFQPSVDDAIDEAQHMVFDARPAARLDLASADGEEGAGATDPHFWLDPTRLASVAAAFTRTLSDADPGGADAYRDHLRRLERRLTALDDDFQRGLADCDSRQLVTSHAAFGYLARRYDLHQVAITSGPEDEPTPAALTEVARHVEADDVRTVYFETLVSDAVARTVADETGARTAVLDPLEGLDDRSPGADYLQVMEANLRSLQRGQPCRPG
jgi:zinc transport system substrate-binding protein